MREIIYSLGLTWRARTLISLGRSIRDGIPEKMEELVRLEGIGIYAAGAYLFVAPRQEGYHP